MAKNKNTQVIEATNTTVNADPSVPKAAKIEEVNPVTQDVNVRQDLAELFYSKRDMSLQELQELTRFDSVELAIQAGMADGKTVIMVPANDPNLLVDNKENLRTDIEEMDIDALAEEIKFAKHIKTPLKFFIRTEGKSICALGQGYRRWNAKNYIVANDPQWATVYLTHLPIILFPALSAKESLLIKADHTKERPLSSLADRTKAIAMDYLNGLTHAESVMEHWEYYLDGKTAFHASDAYKDFKVGKTTIVQARCKYSYGTWQRVQRLIVMGSGTTKYLQAHIDQLNGREDAAILIKKGEIDALCKKYKEVRESGMDPELPNSPFTAMVEEVTAANKTKGEKTPTDKRLSKTELKAAFEQNGNPVVKAAILRCAGCTAMQPVFAKLAMDEEFQAASIAALEKAGLDMNAITKEFAAAF